MHALDAAACALGTIGFQARNPERTRTEHTPSREPPREHVAVHSVAPRQPEVLDGTRPLPSARPRMHKPGSLRNHHRQVPALVYAQLVTSCRTLKAHSAHIVNYSDAHQMHAGSADDAHGRNIRRTSDRPSYHPHHAHSSRLNRCFPLSVAFRVPTCLRLGQNRRGWDNSQPCENTGTLATLTPPCPNLANLGRVSGNIFNPSRDRAPARETPASVFIFHNLDQGWDGWDNTEKKALSQPCPNLKTRLGQLEGWDNSREHAHVGRSVERSNASRPRVASGTWPDDQRLRSSIANAWLESSSMPWKWARSTPRSTGASASEPCGGIGRLSPRTPNSPRLSTKREDRTASRRKPSGARLECASCAAPSASSSSSSRTPTQSRSGRSLAPSRSSASCTPRNRHSPKTT